jgi:D-alanyl-D-alanine carboxypeptidase
MLPLLIMAVTVPYATVLFKTMNARNIRSVVEWNLMEKKTRYVIGALVLFSLILSGLFAYGYLELKEIKKQHSDLQGSYEASRTSLLEKESRIGELEGLLEEIRSKLALSEENGTELLHMFTEEKNRNEDFEQQIGEISGTVGKLDKLSKLDPELLMKYSKIYFLNEHYAPEKLAEIPEAYRLKKEESEYVHAQVLPNLRDLLEDATEDGIDLLVVSGFRSYDEQKGLKGLYSIQYGYGANTFSADQGYSEHQLGTAVDFTTANVGGGLTGFEKTEAYAWLTKYAHKYGFVLSYPENNQYYVFEPWHWRFIGEDLADDLHDDQKSFYDLDQREIDSYLLSIFD